MSKVFISYNREAKTIAKSLMDDIEGLGNKVWFDQELTGGQEWWDKILSAIRDCDIFVFLLNPNSLESTACKREYIYAADLGKPILPILVGDEVATNLLPSVLSKLQYVDFRKRDADATLRLARAFMAAPAAKPLPDPLPASPEVPLSYLSGIGERVDNESEVLTFEQQSSLLVELKDAVREPDLSDDARILLQRLRKRPQLYASIAEEIDEVLGSNVWTGPKRPSQPPPQFTGRSVQSGGQQHSPPQQPPKKSSGYSTGAIVSAVIAISVVVFVVFLCVLLGAIGDASMQPEF